MRADNHGEGGILALMSLTRASWRGRNRYLIVFGLIGAALLYGDGMITPAISVIERRGRTRSRQRATSRPTRCRLPPSCCCCCFWRSGFGTAAVGKVFGPVMLLWFI